MRARRCAPAPNVVRVLLATTMLLALPARPAGAQGQGGQLGFTGAISVDLPLQALGLDAGSGIGVMVRNSSRRAGPWNLRSGLSFDRFGGKGSIDNLQFFTFFGGELVLNNGRHVYEFVGVGAYNTRVAQKTDNGTSPASPANSRRSSAFDFGFQGGVGVNYSLFGAGLFVEAAVVHVLTTGPATSWAPVRFGLRL